MDIKEQERIASEFKQLRQYRIDNKKSLVTHNGELLTSVVYTDPAFAKKIIDYFSPQFKSTDNFYDPCAGEMAFYDNLPDPKDFSEIQLNKDFLEYKQHIDWCFANFPWRGSVYSALSKHSLEISTNVVSLVKLQTAIGTNKRFRDAENENMFIKEIIFCDWNEANFHFPDGSVKGPEGFILAIIHWQKNWSGGTTWKMKF